METLSSGRIKILLAFTAIYLIWGSSFYGVLIALKSFPPFLLSALRLLIAGIAILIYCMVRKEQAPSTVDIKKNMICGVVMFIGGIVAVVWAQQYLSSSLASIIITTPFWFVVLDKRQWRFYFSNKWIIAGLVAGLLGVVLLVSSGNGKAAIGDANMQLVSILVMITGSFLWVSGSLYLKYKPTGSSIYVSTCIQLLAAGLFCLVISLFRHEPQNIVMNEIRTDSLVAIIYLSLVSSLITFMAFIWLIKVRPPAIVSTYAYVNPVVAVLLGWGFAGEHLSGIQFLALVIVLLGVLFVNIPKYKISK